MYIAILKRCAWKGKEHEMIIQLQEVCATICFNALLFYAYLPQAYTLQVSKLMTYSIMFHLLYLLFSKFIIFCNIAYSFIPNSKLNFIGIVFGCLSVQPLQQKQLYWELRKKHLHLFMELKTDNEVC